MSQPNQARSQRVSEALALPTRRAIVDLLASAGSDGLPAGVIASNLDLLQTTIMGHLTTLLHAGLIDCRIQGCRVRYRADHRNLRALAPEFLSADGTRSERWEWPWLDPLIC